jgi:hypothetical protein
MVGVTPVPDQVAVLVARAWMEGGTLRARITFTRDVQGPEESVLVTASREEVLATVRDWLDDISGGGG